MSRLPKVYDRAVGSLSLLRTRPRVELVRRIEHELRKAAVELRIIARQVVMSPRGGGDGLPGLSDMRDLLNRIVKAREQSRDPVGDRADPDSVVALDAIHALCEELVNGASWEVRRDAALELSLHPSSSTRDALFAALEDPAVEVAVAACEAFIHVGEPEDMRCLLDRAQSSLGRLHPLTRAAMVNAAGFHPARENLTALSALASDVASEVSSAALEALGRSGGAEATEVLWRVLEDESGYFHAMSRDVAAAALVASGPLDAERAARLLVTERSLNVREILLDPPGTP